MKGLLKAPYYILKSLPRLFREAIGKARHTRELALARNLDKPACPSAYLSLS
jgi:hypothetical protein